MNRRGWTRGFCFILLLFLSVILVGGPAFAGTGFSDVSDSHWAAKHITKMGSLGIVGGYEDGTFRPNQTVSQVEAVLMAVRCKGGSGDYDDATSVPFTVPAWAQQDVARAMAMGLLKSDEAFYAQSGASRAWVTRLLVRVVGKDAEARSEQVLPTFVDAYKIPDWATGYVKVAQKYNLVGGYSDDTFRPERAVTRAEMAVFLGRAMDFAGESSDAITGRVLEVGSGKVVISADDGKTYTFSVSDQVLVYDENGSIPVYNLQKYDRVSVVADGDTVTYMEKLPGEQVSDLVTGIVQSVYPEMGALVVETPGGDFRTLYLPEGANVSVPGSSQQGLDALQTGDEVEVALNSAGYIAGITVNSRSGVADNEGVVYDLNPAAYLITLQDENGRLYSYRLGENVVVSKEGYRFPTLDDVRAGDRVRLEVEDGAVREIEVLEVSSRLEVNGTVVIVSPEDRVVTLEVEEQLKAFRVSSGATIIVSGLENATLFDVDTGDEVNVRLEDGEIVQLEVEGRQVDNKITGTVVGVDSDNMVLTLEDAQDNLQAYEVKDNARILVEGDESDLDDIEKDMRVEARLVDDEIIFLEVDNSLAGTVASLDIDGLLLVLQDAGGDKETYIVDSHVDVDSEDDRNDWDEIERGDYVEITLDDDVVTEIKLRTQKVLRVERVRENWDRIETEDEDGDSLRLYIRDGVDLVVPGINYPDIEDVHEDDRVRATFIGNDLELVEVLEPQWGEVTSINSYANTVTVKYFNGKSASLDFDSGCEIVIDDDEYDSLSMLSRGDRVEVLENVSGGYDFKVMEEVTGTLAFALDDGDEVYLEDDYRGWEDYDLHSSVYVHDSGGSLSLRSLDKGERVRLYILNDLVYEIEAL